MEELAKLLIARNISIASVESFTVGNFGASLGMVPGVSKIYKGTLVCYQNEIKERLAGIDKATISKYGVVSKEVAGLMAISGQNLFDSDIAVSFTGNAGPDVMEDKEAGLVYVGIKMEQVSVYELKLEGDRATVIFQAVDFAVRKILENIK
ncbi:MAG: CinA family protein [Erysipelotrichaceae bacterium]|nr:CinA family protein [Erysipelotrichaceae bacterium]